jgi:D-alanyl-D-alanine dipeptidase
LSTTVCVRCGAEHDPNASPCREATLVGRTLRAEIRVRERLSDNPLGEFYRAEYSSGFQIAVVLLGPAAAESVALAAQRLRQAIQIQHPNVAAIHELGETPDRLIYVVAECLGGELLSETLARSGAMPQAEALDIFLQAAGGLQAVHAARCIHGNLSPETILLSPTGGGTLVKLIRFAQESPSGPQSPPIEGKVNADYASPERLAGRETDERSDLYSLGAVLHHLLTGVPPTRAPEGGRLPHHLRPVLDRALAPFPARRYQTVAEFVAAIALPVVPRKPEVLIPEPTRSARRNLGWLRVAAAALVVLAAGLWLLWGTQRVTLRSLTWPRAQETGFVARAEPESESASASVSLPPARRQTDSVSASPVQRKALSSGRPAVFDPHPAPSHRPGDSAASDSLLVDVRSVDSTIQVDVRYATANNFTGAPLPGYEAPRAMLRREVAAALGRVQARLQSDGLGLRVFDAYRPVRATLTMVDWAKRTGRRELLESGFIAERSRHNLGVAVDLTMVDLETGTEVPMGTTFDNFTAAAAPMSNAVGGEALRNRQILVQTMASEGFSPYARAWWHFNYPLDGAEPLDRVIR